MLDFFCEPSASEIGIHGSWLNGAEPIPDGKTHRSQPDVARSTKRLSRPVVDDSALASSALIALVDRLLIESAPTRFGTLDDLRIHAQPLGHLSALLIKIQVVGERRLRSVHE